MPRPSDSIVANADMLGRIRHNFQIEGAYKPDPGRGFIELPVRGEEMLYEGATVVLSTATKVGIADGSHVILEPHPSLWQHGLLNFPTFVSGHTYEPGPLELRIELSADLDLSELPYLFRMFIMR